MAVGNQAVERKPAGLDQRRDRDEIGRLPFGGDAEPRLAHEGGREGEGQPLAVEAGQHDLAAGREAADQRIEQAGVAADIVDAL